MCLRAICCLLLCLALPRAGLADCVRVPGLDPLLSLMAPGSDFDARPNMPTNDAVLANIVSSLDKAEVMQAASRIGGQRLSFLSLLFLDDLQRAPDPAQFLREADAQDFLSRFQKERKAHCNFSDATQGETEQGGRGALSRFQEIEQALGLEPPALAYITVALISVFVLGAVLSVVLLDNHMRRRYVQVNRRMNCQIDGKITLLGANCFGNVVILGQKGFRFAFASAAEEAAFESFTDGLICGLEVGGHFLACRMFFHEEHEAGFLFVSELTREQQDSLLDRSQIKPTPVDLTAAELKRVTEAQKKLATS